MARTVIVTGADVSLFHVAAQEMGDPLLAWRLWRANGRPDPMLSGTQVLTVPTPPGVANGGLPAQ